jgi:hypothetical protein
LIFILDDRPKERKTINEKPQTIYYKLQTYDAAATAAASSCCVSATNQPINARKVNTESVES